MARKQITKINDKILFASAWTYKVENKLRGDMNYCLLLFGYGGAPTLCRRRLLNIEQKTKYIAPMLNN